MPSHAHYCTVVHSLLYGYSCDFANFIAHMGTQAAYDAMHSCVVARSSIKVFATFFLIGDFRDSTTVLGTAESRSIIYYYCTFLRPEKLANQSRVLQHLFNFLTQMKARS